MLGWETTESLSVVFESWEDLSSWALSWGTDNVVPRSRGLSKAEVFFVRLFSGVVFLLVRVVCWLFERIRRCL